MLWSRIWPDLARNAPEGAKQTAHAGLIPHFRLASMDVDVRSRLQLVAHTSMHSADRIWQRGCVNVIQESEQMFAISHLGSGIF